MFCHLAGFGRDAEQPRALFGGKQGLTGHWGLRGDGGRPFIKRLPFKAIVKQDCESRFLWKSGVSRSDAQRVVCERPPTAPPQNPGPWCSTSLETRNENGHVISASFPNKYYETVARVEGSFSDRTYNSPQGIWEWWQENTPGDGGIECDVVEFQYDSGGYANDGCPNWGGGGPQNGASYTGWTSYSINNLPPGWSPTAYHKYGMLTTSDGATAVTVCWFVDDRPQSCADVPNIQANEFSQRKFLIMTAYAKGPPVPIIASRDLDVEYIHVWSCTDWVAQMCNGATKSTDGNGVTYWHP